MGEVPRYHLRTAVHCVLMVVRDRHGEHFAQLHAEIAAAGRSARSRGEQHPPDVRIVEAYKQFAPSVGQELCGSIRAKQLKARQLSADGVFQEVAPEFWDKPESKGVLEAALFKPV